MSWHNEYIKIPFEERGRQVDGADCWGLVRIIYHRELGVQLPILQKYTSTKDKDALPTIIQEESSTWQPVKLGDEQPFDVAVFNMCGVPMHVGVVVRQNFMIHCERGSGTTLEDYTDRKWCNRLVGFYRYEK